MPTFHELLKQKIEKFNPYHDARGRFSTSDGATSFTYAPGKSKAHDLAIQREKERHIAQALAPTAAQEKELTRIANRTRNLKKEQLRVVDSDGNVLMEKHGDKGSVAATLGEFRATLPGNISIHNHPDGGTFSPDDLRSLGHGPKELRVAAPEGDYALKATKTFANGAPDTYGWYDMQEALLASETSFKNLITLKREANEKFMPDYNEKVLVHAERWQKARDGGASMEEQQKHIDAYEKAKDAWEAENRPKIEAEVRRLHTKQYHDFYTENAAKYGLEYTFTPVSVKKTMGTQEITKSADTGDIVLDAEFTRKIQAMAQEIIDEITKEE